MVNTKKPLLEYLRIRKNIFTSDAIVVSYMVRGSSGGGDNSLGAREKQEKRMRDNPKDDWRFEEVESLLKHYGCTVRQSSGGSSHYVFQHALLDDQLTVVKKTPLKPVYVKRAYDYIYRIKEELSDE